mmetsp:Transcript_10628/g.26400  ORF Transcript_10628/g.26400 Transcript_10628/m.26400 type:complete len:539 (-) Transcript_10628:96-1712(-)
MAAALTRAQQPTRPWRRPELPWRLQKLGSRLSARRLSCGAYLAALPRRHQRRRRQPTGTERRLRRQRQPAWTARAPQRREEEEDEEEEGELVADRREAMLDDIDRLYSEILVRGDPASRGLDAETSESGFVVAPARPSSVSVSPMPNGCLPRQGSTTRRHHAAASSGLGQAVQESLHTGADLAAPASSAVVTGLHQQAERDVGICEDETEEDAALLENIDRLYAEVLIGGSAASRSSGAAPLIGESVGASEADVTRDDLTEYMATASQAEPDVTPQELNDLLQETLWSALLMTRGAKGHIDVQAGLLEILEPEVLGQCFQEACIATLPSSLSQRLGAELPGLRAALLDAAAAPAPTGTSSSRISSGQLAAKVRQARDYILALACDSELSSEALSSSSSVPDRSKERPRSAGRAGTAAPHKAAPSSSSTPSTSAPLPPRLPRRVEASIASAATLAARAPSVDASLGGAGPDPRAHASAPSSSGGLSSCDSASLGPCGTRKKKTFAANKRGARSSLSHWTSDDLDSLEAPPPHVAEKLPA